MKTVTIKKEEFDALPSSVQGVFKADGDNYTHTFYEEDSTLERAKRMETDRRRKAEEDLKSLRGELEKAEAELHKLAESVVPKEQFDALKKSYDDKAAKLEGDYKGKLEAAQQNLRELLVTNRAHELAASISNSPELLMPVIEKRLSVHEVDGKLQTLVLDSDGKASAATLDDFKKELLANEAYAPIIVASKAAGGSAAGAKKPGSAGTPDLSKMSATEEAAFANEHPEQYAELVGMPTE